MDSTPNLLLPYLMAAQAQKHVTHNEAVAMIDALVHLAVKERGRALAPGDPADGDRYLVGENAAGAFATHDFEIAFFDLGTWRFLAPRAGWTVYVEAEDLVLVHDGAEWRDLGRCLGELANLARLGVGTSADALNRFAAKLNACLFTALASGEGGTGDLRFVLNKAGVSNVLSQLYQRDFSGRAETGKSVQTEVDHGLGGDRRKRTSDARGAHHDRCVAEPAEPRRELAVRGEELVAVHRGGDPFDPGRITRHDRQRRALQHVRRQSEMEHRCHAGERYSSAEKCLVLRAQRNDPGIFRRLGRGEGRRALGDMHISLYDARMLI
jgi:hypothetical protein